MVLWKKWQIVVILVAFLAMGVGIVSVSAQEPTTVTLNPNDATGYTYIALTSGIYRVTYLSGAWSPWPSDNAPYPPWVNKVYIYLNRPAPGQEVYDYKLGNYPMSYSTSSPAEAAAVGTYIDIPMNAGDYIVLVLFDTNPGDNRGSVTVSIGLAESQPPIATIVVMTSPPFIVGNAITLDGSYSLSNPPGTPLTYEWVVTAPDGTTFSLPSVAITTFTPTVEGTYVVKLTVNDGVLSSSITTTLDVQNRPPVADFTWSPDPALVNEEVAFDGSSSQVSDGLTIVSYSWDFGDGNTLTSDSARVPHIYSQDGEYQITLRVTDNQGSESLPYAQTILVLPLDTTPPSTVHYLFGYDKNEIMLTLSATDDTSLTITTYCIFYYVDGSWDGNQGNLFAIDLDDVKRIEYYSIDFAGNVEETHTIIITKNSKEKHFGKQQTVFLTAGDPYYYVDLNLNYFTISADKHKTVIFIDIINGEAWRKSNGMYDPRVHIIAYSILNKNKEIKKTTELVLQDWENIGVVDWTGKIKNYDLKIQVNSNNVNTFPLSKKVFQWIIPTTVGIFYGENKIYYSDTILDWKNIP